MAVDLKLVGLRKVFPGHSPTDPEVVAVDDIDLEVEKGLFVTLLGPSGCGKTTLLRMIAGFEEATGGEIWFGDERVDRLAPNARDTAMVFQSYAIFPHLNVFENVAFGLRMKRIPGAELNRRVGEVLELVGLTQMAKRQPSALSGGQQQRVALARCIVLEPRLLLFDEPLSNLDAKLREQMRLEIRDLQRRLGITSVYVTHDQAEAMAMSDLVLVMNRGRVEQAGSPHEIYATPANRFVADFIGKANFLAGTVRDPLTAEVGGKGFTLTAPTREAPGTPVTLVARPEAVRLDRPDAAGSPGLPGTVRRALFLGNHAEYEVEIPGVGTLESEVSNPAGTGMFAVGDQVVVGLGALHALSAEV